MDLRKRKYKKPNSKGDLLFFGIPALFAFCCGLPFLLIALGLTSIGTFLIGKEIWEFGVILLLIGLIMFVKHMISRKNNERDCCEGEVK